ncbi:hypothetical protein H6F78_07915 [Coleofasciculus sp. FACHB-64]|uniref:hypothetical protein n=1 Tax=Cyanophyceae TaxID=3028117 RepID=UPI0016859487|nr:MULTISPECIES: hypothetical protein [unclassified Coleofasciculus]MBD1840018.1 hypothetical protein [Coleofasciculus sp. FACHB-501]MBD1892993.1 hypothetical protein [Coleofasciculus sp. FACHB-SPT9]MBD2045521.1 hypothetical protein [Coleofasciculus sp. FACHB-64]
MKKLITVAALGLILVTIGARDAHAAYNHQKFNECWKWISNVSAWDKLSHEDKLGAVHYCKIEANKANVVPNGTKDTFSAESRSAAERYINNLLMQRSQPTNRPINR